MLLGGLVIAAAVVLAVRAGTGTPARPARVVPPPPPIMVDVAGDPLLGVTAGWDLFARSGSELIRIQLALGRFIQTFVPTLASGNPDVSFLVGAHEAVIRPFDEVPGYVVPDHEEARLLTGPLSGGGPGRPRAGPAVSLGPVRAAGPAGAVARRAGGPQARPGHPLPARRSADTRDGRL